MRLAARHTLRNHLVMDICLPLPPPNRRHAASWTTRNDHCAVHPPWLATPPQAALPLHSDARKGGCGHRCLADAYGVHTQVEVPELAEAREGHNELLLCSVRHPHPVTLGFGPPRRATTLPFPCPKQSHALAPRSARRDAKQPPRAASSGALLLLAREERGPAEG